MDKQKKHSIIITICTIILMVIILMIYFGVEEKDDNVVSSKTTAINEEVEKDGSLPDVDEIAELDEEGIYIYEWREKQKIAEDGSLYMWGDNTFGQFGDGSLLTDGSSFKTDCFFYLEPVKVADNIKMVWEKHPGLPKQTEEYGDLRTYFLTTENELFVSGENIGNEVRSYMYFGELGKLEEPYEVSCTSILHKVVMGEKTP